MLSCELHYSGHFLINAADKAVAHHLIRSQHATSLWKLPPTTHDSLTSANPSHLELLKAFCLFISPSWVNSLLGRMMPHCQHYSPIIPSSVFEPPQYVPLKEMFLIVSHYAFNIIII